MRELQRQGNSEPNLILVSPKLFKQALNTKCMAKISEETGFGVKLEVPQRPVSRLEKIVGCGLAGAGAIGGFAAAKVYAGMENGGAVFAGLAGAGIGGFIAYHVLRIGKKNAAYFPFRVATHIRISVDYAVSRHCIARKSPLYSTIPFSELPDRRTIGYDPAQPGSDRNRSHGS